MRGETPAWTATTYHYKRIIKRIMGEDLLGAFRPIHCLVNLQSTRSLQEGFEHLKGLDSWL